MCRKIVLYALLGFSDVLCITGMSRRLDSIITGILTLVLVESSGSHLGIDHFVITQCKTLSDFNVAL